MSSSSSEGQWQKRVDSDGRTYFYNSATKESRWDDPAVTGDSPWQVLEDDTTGGKYYFNKVTGKSQWTVPDEIKDRVAAAAEAAAGGSTAVAASTDSPSNSSGGVATVNPLTAPATSKGTDSSPPSKPRPATPASSSTTAPTAPTDPSMANRVRRLSMLPDSSKASARRAILAAAERVKNGTAEAGAGAGEGNSNSNNDNNSSALTRQKSVRRASDMMSTMRVAKGIGKWRGKARAGGATGAGSAGQSLDNGRGLPVRETLQAMYKINRDKTLKEALLFLLWTILFVGIVYAVNDVHLTFSTNDALIDLFLDEEFSDANYKKNFHEIMTMGELWTFIRGPVFEGLYPDEWYNGLAYTDEEQGYLLHYMRLIGGVQFRQARVSNSSCSERRFTDETLDGQPRFDTKDGTCFSEFTISKQDTEAFGPDGRYAWSGDNTELQGLYNFGPDYGKGGFVTLLGTNRTEAKDTIDQLFTDLWTDRGTRLVAISFSVYNTNTKLLSSVRILVEMFMSGHFVRSFKFFTCKIVVYQSRIDTLRMFGEFAFCGFFLYYLQKEIRSLYHHRPIIMYFYKFRNIFEVVFLSSIMAAIVAWLLFIADSTKRNFTVNAPQFVDHFPLAEKFMNVYTIAGFIGLAACLKVFKFLSISKKMNALWLTLFRAAPDLIAFIVGFVVLVGGFAFMASMIFGFMLSDFHNFLASFSTLLRFPLGDFDYDMLQVARPAITGVFFTMYVGMVFLVCMNMIIGIVTKYFDEVHHELKYSDKWKISTVSLEAHMMQRASRTVRITKRWCQRRCCKRSAASGSDSLQSEAALAEEQAARTQDSSDQCLVQGWETEARFTSFLHDMMRQAKRVKSIDMFHYFDQLYTSQPTTSLYVGVHELCTLTKSKPCPPAGHKECLARQVLDAYNNVKSVTIVGKSARHQPEASELINKDHPVFKVLKVNRNGFSQKRSLIIDPKSQSLFNFSRKMELKKQLPLKQLIQLDRSKSDPCRLLFMFTSNGMAYTGRFSLDAMETAYDLIFETPQERDLCCDLVAAIANAQSGDPLATSSLSVSNPLHTVSRRQARTRQSLAGAAGPRDMAGEMETKQQPVRSGGATDSGATPGAAAGGASAPSRVASVASGGGGGGGAGGAVSSRQLGVIVEHMRSQRAALRILMEQMHQLRADVSRFQP